MNKLEERVKQYWTVRAKDFGAVRRNELTDHISSQWLAEIQRHFLNNKSMKILDIGTGTGYFAILLSQKGHQVIGIDLTPAMLEEARQDSAMLGLDIDFLEMDAQSLSFEDNTFDAVVSRNLTWTLPNPEQAFAEWFRVLKPNGILLNFDADYAANIRNKNQKASYIRPDEAYGHYGITKELEQENNEITFAMPACRKSRPAWDITTLKKTGFRTVEADPSAGLRILKEHDLSDAPMFLVYAVK